MKVSAYSHSNHQRPLRQRCKEYGHAFFGQYQKECCIAAVAQREAEKGCITWGTRIRGKTGTVQTVTGPTDLSAPYGGGEFACILSGTDMKGAVAVAQRIIGAVRSLNLPDLSSPVARHRKHRSRHLDADCGWVTLPSTDPGCG